LYRLLLWLWLGSLCLLLLLRLGGVLDGRLSLEELADFGVEIGEGVGLAAAAEDTVPPAHCYSLIVQNGGSMLARMCWKGSCRRRRKVAGRASFVVEALNLGGRLRQKESLLVHCCDAGATATEGPKGRTTCARSQLQQPSALIDS